MPFLRGSTATTVICGPFYMSDGLSIATAGLLNITSATAVDMFKPPSGTKQDIQITAAGGNAFNAVASTGMCTLVLQVTQLSSIGLMSISFALPSTRPFRQDWDVIMAEEFDRMFGTGAGFTEVQADTLSIMRDVSSVLAQVAIVNAQNVSILVSTASLLVNVNKIIADDVSLMTDIDSIIAAVAVVNAQDVSILISTASLLANVATGTASTMVGIASLLVNVAALSTQVAILKADDLSMMRDIASLVSSVSALYVYDYASWVLNAGQDVALASLLVNVAALSTQVAILKADDVSMLSAIAAVKADTASLISAVSALVVIDTANWIINQGEDIALASLIVSVNSLLIDTSISLPAQIAALNNLSAAQVNTEVVDALTVDTYGEIGQTVISSVATLADKIGYLYKDKRNKKTATSTAINIFADDGVTVDQKIAQQDDSVTYTRGEVEKGP